MRSSRATYYPAGLEHQLPHERIGHSLIEVSNVDSRLLILLPVSCAGHRRGSIWLLEGRRCVVDSEW